MERADWPVSSSSSLPSLFAIPLPTSALAAAIITQEITTAGTAKVNSISIEIIPAIIIRTGFVALSNNDDYGTFVPFQPETESTGSLEQEVYRTKSKRIGNMRPWQNNWSSKPFTDVFSLVLTISPREADSEPVDGKGKEMKLSCDEIARKASAHSLGALNLRVMCHEYLCMLIHAMKTLRQPQAFQSLDALK
ncbi:uncharacterized protein LOC144239519 [Crocuta crocuta]